MIALAFLAYSALIFFLGVKHERSCTFWLHQPGPFQPHEPRLLDSTHLACRSDAINTRHAPGAGFSNQDN